MKINKSVFSNTKLLLILSIVLFGVFTASLFSNISHPLFWADESMTAIGSERVLEFGYPKVHDGKNVFYDLRHSNPNLGRNEKDDAYIGGSGWGQYYFGAIGYSIASKTNDIYLKTGLYRATFAIIGLLGLALICFFISSYFPDKTTKYTFISMFILLELFSVSLVLLMREVRYYSLVIFLTCLIFGLYSKYKFHKPFSKPLFILIESLALLLLFVTFSPVFFITLLTITLSELVSMISKSAKEGLMQAAKKSATVFLTLLITIICALPLLSYFKTFEISKAMNEFNGYNSAMYWKNFTTIISYFFNFELLLLAIVVKLISIINIRKLIIENSSIFKVSNLLTLFFIVSIFTIARIPNFIYTRYIIYLQPFLSIIIILDFFITLNIFSSDNNSTINYKSSGITIIFIVIF